MNEHITKLQAPDNVRLRLPFLTLLVVTVVTHVLRPDAAAVSRPASPSFQESVVAIDEAHQNTHTYASPEFRGLVALLDGGGYKVRPFTERVTSSTLSDIAVLIVSGPGGWAGPEASFSDAEVANLMQWIRNGGSLLLILDHMPAPRNAASLTKALGVSNWHNGYTMVAMRDSPAMGPIIFWRTDSLPAAAPEIGPTGPGGGRGYQGTDAVLAKHPITDGRTANERVQRVATFTGSAFQAPPGAEALLTMPGRAISLTPPLTPNAMPTFSADTPRIPVAGWLQGAVLRIGQGRVALFGESGLFSGGPAADNRTFVINLLRWLTGVL